MVSSVNMSLRLYALKELIPNNEFCGDGLDDCTFCTAGELRHSQMSGGGISIRIQSQNVFPSCIVSQWSLLYVSLPPPLTNEWWGVLDSNSKFPFVYSIPMVASVYVSLAQGRGNNFWFVGKHLTMSVTMFIKQKTKNAIKQI